MINKIVNEQLEILRHSTAHIMAQAVSMLFPQTKFGIGPAISDGFYYDFDLPVPLSPEQLSEIEKKMQSIIKANLVFEQTMMEKSKAIDFFSQKEERYKIEIIQDIPDDEVSIYQQGDFIDLCRGPHIKSTGMIKAFKLLSIAGAYWRGDEKNSMLTRIYGTAFETTEELEKYLYQIEEAKKRDHRKLGKELGIFQVYDEAGPGLIYYHPKGAIVREEICRFLRLEHAKREYLEVVTPNIARVDLWKTSGHYDFYRENMYFMNVDNMEYVLKPMNCPGHILIYKSHTRSYRDLPLRLFELGTVYRHERSGVLHGLLRVRGFTQDDAHIFCMREQLKDEIQQVLDFIINTLVSFGFKEYEIYLSTRPEKYTGSDEIWDMATSALEMSLKEKGLPYQIDPGEGVFYGPKIDIKLKDALSRTWQGPTIQVDFNLPERFNVTYVGQDGKEHQPVMIHRVVLGSLERFMGALIEHYAGAFPVWLSPIQVLVATITEKHKQYGEYVQNQLRANQIRCDMDSRNEKIGFKIREAQLQKLPYVLILGDNEEQNKTVSIRKRGGKDLGQMTIEDFISVVSTEIREKNVDI
ncbi:MAG: threonine--tRNA ligase [bacterium]|nr:threonine--tRNA ligase [bacterium]